MESTYENRYCHSAGVFQMSFEQFFLPQAQLVFRLLTVSGLWTMFSLVVVLAHMDRKFHQRRVHRSS